MEIHRNLMKPHIPDSDSDGIDDAYLPQEVMSIGLAGLVTDVMVNGTVYSYASPSA